MWQRKERFSVSQVAFIAAQVASALDYLHDQGLVHRDVAPASIFQRDLQDIQVQLTNFGKMRRQGEFDPADAFNFIRGGYMSPESWSSVPHPASIATDVYSLGIVVYEILTGHFPFEGNRPDEIIENLLRELPVPLSRFRPDLPHTLDLIVGKALAKDPEERYQRAGEFIAEFSKYALK